MEDNFGNKFDWEKEWRFRFPISIDYPPITEMEVFTQIEVDDRHKRALAKDEQQRQFISKLIDIIKQEEKNICENRINHLINNIEYSGFTQDEINTIKYYLS